MQTGFVPNTHHLGTALDVQLPSKRAAKVKDSYAQKVFEQSMNGIEGVNERNIVYPKFATALQGMTLTNVPTGGFSSPPPNIIMGADVGGAVFNSAAPTYFNQPGGTKGSKRMEMHNGTPLTGERLGDETVFKGADPKLKNVHGAMSVRRAEQEAEKGKRRMMRVRTEQFGGAAPAPFSGAPSVAPSYAVPPIQRQVLNVSPSSEPILPQNDNTAFDTAPYVPARILNNDLHEDNNRNGNGVISNDSNGNKQIPSAIEFSKSLMKWATKKLPQTEQDCFFAQNWPYFLCILLFVLLLIMFIVSICVSVKASSKVNYVQMTGIKNS
jgi:hypothetical protein